LWGVLVCSGSLWSCVREGVFLLEALEADGSSSWQAQMVAR
jgi:hypothetical protein